MDVTLDQLRLQHEVISIESSALSNTLEFLPRRLPGFVTGVRNFINVIVGADAPNIVDVSQSRKLDKVFKKVGYIDAGGLRAYVPGGMTSTYPEYLSTLEDNVELITKLIPDVLSPALRTIAVLLSEPSRLSSIRSATKDFSDIKFFDLENSRNEMQKHYDPKSINDRVKYSEVVNNHSEWFESVEAIGRITEMYKSVSRKDIIEYVTEITQALETLLERTQSDPDTYKITGSSMRIISDVAYGIAEHAEFYSVTSYQLQQLSQAMHDTTKQLEKSLS